MYSNVLPQESAVRGSVGAKSSNSLLKVFYSQGSKIEKAPRGIQGEKSSKDMTSSRNLVSTVGAQTSPKKGGGAVESLIGWEVTVDQGSECHLTFVRKTTFLEIKLIRHHNNCKL